ncbi:hypothetical protein [uncultured Helicobacter sp.]|uniref:hypothetical protein n=1 Tax=uncultured Helicobacter sp. TaxID=175537 RepID=UPI00374E215C
MTKLVYRSCGMNPPFAPLRVHTLSESICLDSILSFLCKFCYDKTCVSLVRDESALRSATRAYSRFLESKTSLGVSASGTRFGNGIDSINPPRFYHFYANFAMTKLVYRSCGMNPPFAPLRVHTLSESICLDSLDSITKQVHCDRVSQTP